MLAAKESKTVEWLPITELRPYARNARTHSPEQIEVIAKSIREFGFTNPVLIDEQGMILAGHGRVAAANHLRMLSVPCIRITGLTETQKRAYVIADNQTALRADWDDELLRTEVRGLHREEYNLDVLGFDAIDLGKMLADFEAEEVPRAMLGEPKTCPNCGYELAS